MINNKFFIILSLLLASCAHNYSGQPSIPSTCSEKCSMDRDACYFWREGGTCMERWQACITKCLDG